jgi:hypothetical protein
MHAASRPEAIRWLVENGPKELELSFWTIIYGSSAPILIADDDRICRAGGPFGIAASRKAHCGWWVGPAPVT